MSGLLQHHEDDGYARCVHCGKPAVGPCARCEAPVCGNCCELTEGGTKTYAVCLSCADRGTSLDPAWRTVVGWILLPIVILAAAVALLGKLMG